MEVVTLEATPIPLRMYNRVVLRRGICVLLVLLSGISILLAQERYDRKFFIQLRGVFGRFRDSDLERVFERAQPIQCSELVNDEGEWRTVAFFNEKRELGGLVPAQLRRGEVGSRRFY